MSSVIGGALEGYRYAWPGAPLGKPWRREGESLVRELAEDREGLARDSRWPAFFPSPISLVTTGDGNTAALEKVVGATIVNRFPYVIALSFCREGLSDRHYARDTFTSLLERSGAAAVQFLPPGAALDRALGVISGEEAQTAARLESSGLSTRRAVSNPSPVLSDAYLIYEARLVRPSTGFAGEPLYEQPWVDLGSHRVYLLEINTIQLREDIARGEAQIAWRSLPAWSPSVSRGLRETAHQRSDRYSKGYTPHYRFPSAGTVAFEHDELREGMAIKHLAPLPADQVEVDDDRARWPCFFPSSVGMITVWSEDGQPNLMPCGSTSVLSRHPLVISPCVSYAPINQRYAPRASLEMIRKTGRFGCGVPFIEDAVLEAIRYTGSTSLAFDRNKVANAGLEVLDDPWAPVLPALPIHFDCEVTGEVALGTHVMFLGEVKRIRLRADLTPEAPLEWYPFADVVPAG